MQVVGFQIESAAFESLARSRCRFFPILDVVAQAKFYLTSLNSKNRFPHVGYGCRQK